MVIVRADRVVRSIAQLGALLACTWASLPAQTQDEARLVVGISAGVVGSVPLYTVAGQSIIPVTGHPSAYELRRGFRTNVTASGHLTYFPSPRLGLLLEFTYLGLGTTDTCVVTQDGGELDLQRACDALDGKQRSPASSEIQAGFVFRPLPQSPIQPYAKLAGGMAFTPNSTMYTVSEYRGENNHSLVLTVYRDDSVTTVRPSWTAAFGISTAPHTGYQVRLEVRQSWMRVEAVTGPTAHQGLAPPRKLVFKGFPSIVVGFDVVLAKRRGRRY